MLEVLAERAFPVAELVPLASARSAGRSGRFGGGELEVRELSDESIARLRHRALLGRRRGQLEWAPRFVAAGAVVVDNSSFWRMDDDVPLVVAEVNPGGDRRPPRDRRQPELLDDADGRRAEADPRRGRDRAADRLDLPVGLGDRPARDRGAARPGAAVLAGDEVEAHVYPHQIAFNVLPQVETFKEGDDYTTEERKMMAETRKILGADDELGISATCARVPVFNAHSESVNVQTRELLAPEGCRELLAALPGWSCVDDPAEGIYPLRDRRGGPRRGPRRPDPSRPLARALPEPLDRRRQPPQGRRHERRSARRAARRARPRPGPRARPGRRLSRAAALPAVAIAEPA